MTNLVISIEISFDSLTCQNEIEDMLNCYSYCLNVTADILNYHSGYLKYISSIYLIDKFLLYSLVVSSIVSLFVGIWNVIMDSQTKPILC